MEILYQAYPGRKRVYWTIPGKIVTIEPDTGSRNRWFPWLAAPNLKMNPEINLISTKRSFAGFCHVWRFDSKENAWSAVNIGKVQRGAETCWIHCDKL